MVMKKRMIYLSMAKIQRAAASGENGILLPDLMRRHFFSVLFIMSLLCLPSLLRPPWKARVDLCGVKETNAFYEMAMIQAAIQPWEIFLCSTAGHLVLSCREVDHLIRKGASPIRLLLWTSSTNSIRWSPTPFPAGITHAHEYPTDRVWPICHQ